MAEVADVITRLLTTLRLGAETWWVSLPTGEFLEPLSVFLFCSAALAGVVGGRLTIMLGAAIWATLSICLIATQPPEEKLFVTGAIASAHGLLLISACTYRLRVKRLLNATRALEAQNREVQARLDREVLWRTAAEVG